MARGSRDSARGKACPRYSPVQKNPPVQVQSRCLFEGCPATYPPGLVNQAFSRRPRIAIHYSRRVKRAARTPASGSRAVPVALPHANHGRQSLLRQTPRLRPRLGGYPPTPADPPTPPHSYLSSMRFVTLHTSRLDPPASYPLPRYPSIKKRDGGGGVGIGSRGRDPPPTDGGVLEEVREW